MKLGLIFKLENEQNHYQGELGKKLLMILFLILTEVLFTHFWFLCV